MAPTNILRADNARTPRSPRSRRRAGETREIVIRAGRVAVRARLLATPTADRLWERLPIYAAAEPWGQSIHFETVVDSGREPNARRNLKPGELAFWVEDDRIILAWGMTPISKAGEMRMPAPVNIFARALDDLAVLAAVGPGERVAVLAADS